MEKREYKRMPIDIQITLQEVNSAFDCRSFSNEKISAKAVDLSSTGIGFIANISLTIGKTYTTHILYGDFNPFIITLRVINKIPDHHKSFKYGCVFEGNIGKLDQTPFFESLYQSLYL